MPVLKGMQDCQFLTVQKKFAMKSSQNLRIPQKDIAIPLENDVAV